MSELFTQIFLGLSCILLIVIIVLIRSVYYSNVIRPRIRQQVAIARKDVCEYDSDNTKNKELNEVVFFLGINSVYKLYYHYPTKLYISGCRTFTRKQALRHWSDVRDTLSLHRPYSTRIQRAILFLQLIKNHKP